MISSFEQLQDIKGKSAYSAVVLASVANHLAQDNEVLLWNHKREMVVLMGPGPSYQQFVGSLDQ